MAFENISFVVDVFALVLAVILLIFLISYMFVWRQQMKWGLERRRFDFRLYASAAAFLFAITLFLRLFAATSEIAVVLYSVLNVVILAIFIFAFQMKFREAVALVASAKAREKQKQGKR